MSFACLLFLLLLSLVNSAPPTKSYFNLSVIHINDFHARFEETDELGSPCEGSKCVGGFSRMYTMVHNLLKQTPDALVLDGGDTFQGTIWYTILKWKVVQYFINKIPFDAHTLGNHEFDDGVDGLVPYIKGLNAPMVIANMDDRSEPKIQGIYKKSVVIERNGRKIGIIGVLAKNTDEKGATGKIKFYDESESVNAEAERLVREENVFTNIVLSHCGYNVEMEIAKKSKHKISIIVGAHSHSLLYTGVPVPGRGRLDGPYPTVITTKADGNKVLVIQASSFALYVGNITVSFDRNGNAISWAGNPIYLDSNVLQDRNINKELRIWRSSIDSKDRNVGSTLVTIDGDSCLQKECIFGNLFTDAMVLEYTNNTKPKCWTNSSIAIVNGGNFRQNLPMGNISHYQLLTAIPFGNTVDTGSIEGRYLRKIFEFAAKQYEEYLPINILQVSGIHVSYNLSRAPGSRITSIQVRCADCIVPEYTDLDDNQIYQIALTSFLTNGGNGFKMIPKYLKNVRIGNKEIDVLERYLRLKSPVFAEIEERILISGTTKRKSKNGRIGLSTLAS